MSFSGLGWFYRRRTAVQRHIFLKELRRTEMEKKESEAFWLMKKVIKLRVLWVINASVILILWRNMKSFCCSFSPVSTASFPDLVYYNSLIAYLLQISWSGNKRIRSKCCCPVTNLWVGYTCGSALAAPPRTSYPLTPHLLKAHLQDWKILHYGRRGMISEVREDVRKHKLT